MSFPRYPKYKPSGVEWLGEVPEGWEVKPLRSVFKFSKGLTITKENLQDEGVNCVNYGEIHSKYGFRLNPAIHPLRCVSPEYLSTNPEALIRDGDFVFADTSEDLEGSGNFTHLRSDDPIFAGYHTIIARPRKDTCSLFLAYQIHSSVFRSQIQSQVKGVKVFSISQGILKGAKCWLPPLPEQTAIAEFLDRETGKIDGLVAEQRRLMELLKEKRQAVISHAVTKGLNPHAPMKPSGIEWLGDVPERWEVGPVKRYFKSCNTRRIPLSGEERGGRSGVYPYYGASGIIDYIDEFIFDEDLVLVSEDGANLLNRASPIAFVATGKYWVNNHAHILRPIDSNFVFWAARIESIDITPFVTGSAQPKFTSEALGALIISAPPLEEQRVQIQNHILAETAKFDALTTEAQRVIDLLQERRTALISAAVTGQIDVRQHTKN